MKINKGKYELHLAMERRRQATEERSDLDLSFGNIKFDPSKHRRNLTGQFIETLDKLKPAQSVDLPDGSRVTRKAKGDGFELHSGSADKKHMASGDKEVISKIALPGLDKTADTETKHNRALEDFRDLALEKDYDDPAGAFNNYVKGYKSKHSGKSDAKIISRLEKDMLREIDKVHESNTEGDESDHGFSVADQNLLDYANTESDIPADELEEMALEAENEHVAKRLRDQAKKAKSAVVKKKPQAADSGINKTAQAFRDAGMDDVEELNGTVSGNLDYGGIEFTAYHDPDTGALKSIEVDGQDDVDLDDEFDEGERLHTFEGPNALADFRKEYGNK